MTGSPGDDLDWQAGHEARAGRTGQEDWVPAVTSIRRLAGSGRVPGSRRHRVRDLAPGAARRRG